MTPAAAKLLMCVCAGSTGAVMVPAAHKAKAAFGRPAVHRAVTHRPAAAGAVAIAAAPCLPIVTAGGAGGLPATLPLETPVADLGLFSGAGARGGNASGGGGIATGGGGSIGGGGFSDFGPAADMSGPLPSGPGAAPGSGVVLGGGVVPTAPVLIPTAAAVPEPASWAMMISGFSIVGGGMRWQRRVVA